MIRKFINSFLSILMMVTNLHLTVFADEYTARFIDANNQLSNKAVISIAQSDYEVEDGFSLSIQLNDEAEIKELDNSIDVYIEGINDIEKVFYVQETPVYAEQDDTLSIVSPKEIVDITYTEIPVEFEQADNELKIVTDKFGTFCFVRKYYYDYAYYGEDYNYYINTSTKIDNNLTVSDYTIPEEWSELLKGYNVVDTFEIYSSHIDAKVIEDKVEETVVRDDLVLKDVTVKINSDKLQGLLEEEKMVIEDNATVNMDTWNNYSLFTVVKEEDKLSLKEIEFKIVDDNVEFRLDESIPILVIEKESVKKETTEQVKETVNSIIGENISQENDDSTLPTDNAENTENPSVVIEEGEKNPTEAPDDNQNNQIPDGETSENEPQDTPEETLEEKYQRLLEEYEADDEELSYTPEEELDDTTPLRAMNIRNKGLLTASNISIRSFNTQLFYGAELDGSDYVWTANSSTRGHRFSFRINYAFSGVDEIAAETINIKVPLSILNDRNGADADYMEWSIPSREEYESDPEGWNSEFAYYVDNNEAVIYNTVNLSAGSEGYIEISYLTSKPTTEYQDMGVSEDFTATLTLGSLSATASPLNVIINTNVNISGTTKKYPNTIYKSWDSSWGTAPADADQYYYLVWEIETRLPNDITQPYNFKLEDTVTCSNFNVEVVGYKFTGQSAFSTQNTIDNQTRNNKRYDYVLTRHKKSDITGLLEYRIDNTIKATVIPVDLVDDETNAVSSNNYTWHKPSFVIPSGSVNVYKYGDGYYRDTANTRLTELGMKANTYSRYDLEELQEGNVQSLNNFDFAVFMIGYTYPWTVDGDAADPANYGIKPVTFTLVDEEFYLEDTLLTTGDYQIDKIAYALRLSDMAYDNEEEKFVSTALTYADTDILNIYGKFDGDYVLIATRNYKTGAIWFDINYVNNVTNDTVLLKDGCVAYKFETSNAHYFTAIDTVPNYRIKNSSTVMNLINGKNSVVIKNTSYGMFTQEDGTEIANISATDYDYARITERTSNIEKTIVSSSNSIRKKQYIIGWSVSMKEQFIAGEDGSKQYIPQESGVFYDLLPKGSSVVSNSIAIKTDNGYISDSSYQVKQIANYKNSGQTLLVIRIKDEFEYATVYYDTMHSWDSINDYGNAVYNAVAYETGNEKIADGLPDNGGSLEIKTLFTDLDPDTDERKFIYSEKHYDIAAITAAASGLTKKVKVPADEDYSYDTIVSKSGDYQYRMRYMNNFVTTAKNIIMYDNLEQYVVEGKSSDWFGTLLDIDLSQIEEKGCKPVVYLSATPKNIETENDLSSGWIKLENFGDISQAKAIAIDMRKKANGTDFVLEPGESVTAVLYMRAPDSASSVNNYPETYNNIWIKDTISSIYSTGQDFFIHQDYTTVKFVIANDVKILKVNEENTSEVVRNIKFRLTGTSDYGTQYDEILTTDKSGIINFVNIEKGNYILQEYEANDDWILDTTEHRVLIDNNSDVYIDGNLTTGLYYQLTDKPRVHTNINLVKVEEGSLINYEFEDDVFEDGMAKYAVAIYGIAHDADVNGETLGLTFGPATGYNPIETPYISHEASGTTVLGNLHRCVHNDSWEEIIYWNIVDPYVYEQCIAEGCTHSVYLDIPSVMKKTIYTINGDGPSVLRDEIIQNARRWNTTGPNYTSSLTTGAWGASNIRAVLNGVDDETNLDAAQTNNNVWARNVSINSSNALISSIPDLLRYSIAQRKTLYTNTSVCYDKLFLFSQKELADSIATNGFNEGKQYERMLNQGAYNANSSLRVGRYLSSATKTGVSFWWTRSLGESSGVVYVNSTGSLANRHNSYNDDDIAFGFSLSRNSRSIINEAVNNSDSGSLPGWINDIKAPSKTATYATPTVSKKYIENTTFKLSGTSDYGTAVNELLTTDERGKISFTNIEKGTYTLEEIVPNEDYVRNNTKWTVVIDDNSLVSITALEENRDRLYETVEQLQTHFIFNEPRYWDFSLRKVDKHNNTIWLEGATFNLKGISDLGTEYDLTATSDTNGKVMFTEVEKGTYLLQETAAPQGVDEQGHLGGNRNYIADKNQYIVNIDYSGKVTIEGLVVNDFNDFVVENDRALDGEIIITKEWDDGLTNEERLANGYPVLHLMSTEPQYQHGITVTAQWNGDGGKPDNIVAHLVNQDGTMSETSGTWTKNGNVWTYVFDVLVESNASTYYVYLEELPGENGRFENEEGYYYVRNGAGKPAKVSGQSAIVNIDYEDKPFVRYAVALYGIEHDEDVEGNLLGLTFGPALGANYIEDYHSHTPIGTTSNGNEHRCIHNDSWDEIVYWNNIDPYVYEQCIAEGCTHSIKLIVNDLFITNATYLANLASHSGDGPSVLCVELFTQHLRWNPLQGETAGEQSSGTNAGGWGASRIRAMLNGADNLTMTGDTYATSLGSSTPTVKATDYGDSAGTLFDTFPEVLRNNIATRKTAYNATYNSADVSYCGDKLFLFSQREVSDTTYSLRSNEGSEYEKFISLNGAAYDISVVGRIGYRFNTSAGTDTGTNSRWWLRSPYGAPYIVYDVFSTGNANYNSACYNIYNNDGGVAPGFSLSRNAN